jgi:hypothetical protein
MKFDIPPSDLNSSSPMNVYLLNAHTSITSEGVKAVKVNLFLWFSTVAEISFVDNVINNPEVSFTHLQGVVGP